MRNPIRARRAFAAAFALGMATSPALAATPAAPVLDPAKEWTRYLADGSAEQMTKAYETVFAVLDGRDVDAGKCRKHEADFDRGVAQVPVGAGLWYYGYLCAKATGDHEREERYYANFTALATYAFGRPSADPAAPPIRIAHTVDMESLVAASGLSVRYSYYERDRATRDFPIHVALYDEQSGQERHFRFDQVDTLARIARQPALAGQPGARIYIARAVVKEQAADNQLLGQDMKAIWDSEAASGWPAKLDALRPAAKAGGLRALARWRYICRQMATNECAVEWLDMILPRVEAHQAYPTALLALAYGEGFGVPKDTAAAMKLLADADAHWAPGEATVAYARQWLADDAGDFPPELVARLQLARAAGNRAPDPLAVWSRVYGDKHPVLPDAELKALTAQAEKRLPTAVSMLADYYRGQKDMVTAMIWLRLAADAGDPDAQSTMASALYFGDGVDQDKEAGLAWMKRAAEGGDSYALRFMGNHLRFEQDWKGAEAYYSACTYTRQLDCVYELAELYLGGHPGLDGDAQEGLRLLRALATDGDSARARRRLAGLMIEGKVVAKDLVGARAMLEKDAQAGDTASQLQFGAALADGAFGARDETAGYDWMKRSLDAGDENAPVALGSWLYYRKATPESRKQALAIWRKASEGDDSVSANNLAWAECTSSDAAEYAPQDGLQAAHRIGELDTLGWSFADTVSACYAANGEFERAVEIQERAVKQAAEGKADEPTLRQLRDRLEQFRRHERYVEAPPTPAPAPAP